MSGEIATPVIKEMVCGNLLAGQRFGCRLRSQRNLRLRGQQGEAEAKNDEDGKARFHQRRLADFRRL